jgi:hypothetical protein
VQIRTIATSADGYKTRLSLHAGTRVIVANILALTDGHREAAQFDISHWLQKLFAFLPSLR